MNIRCRFLTNFNVCRKFCSQFQKSSQPLLIQWCQFSNKFVFRNLDICQKTMSTIHVVWACCVYFFFTKFANDLWLVQRSLTKDYLRACSIFSIDGSILNSSRKRAKCGKKGLGKQLQCHVSCHCIFHQKRNWERRGGDEDLFLETK